MAGINEPRIHTQKPTWANLEEIKREGKTVWFRTRTGMISVIRSDVERYENHQKSLNSQT